MGSVLVGALRAVVMDGIDGQGTKSAVSQLKAIDREIGMDTPAEFRKHAADCEIMARVSRDPETKAAWKRMAERWVLCANLAEDKDLVLRRRAEERAIKAASKIAAANIAKSNLRRQLARAG
jgi:hypothetical protein